MDAGEWYIVSDLHLSDGPRPRDVDAALCRFLETVVVAGNGSSRRIVVLLGDTFDLQGPVQQSQAAIAARLISLANAHGRILDTLAACVHAGIGLHVVGGNHDVELTRPTATALFTSLLGLEVGHPGVRFSPWVVHEPGVLYAEHGSQHHEFNRMPTVLSVREYGDRPEELPVTPLAAASRGSPWCPGRGRAAVRVAQSVWCTGRHERLARSPWYQGLLEREADLLGMSSRALADLSALSRFGVGRALAATARRTVQRGVGAERPGTFLAPRAAAIHGILTQYGLPAAAYVFGHTHRAERLELPGPPNAVYVNAGTWSADVRGRGPDTTDRQLFPFVRIVAGPGGVEADLLFWRHPE